VSTNDADDDDAPLSPKEEAILKEELEAALEMYRGIAPPDLLETMRRIGVQAGRTHPVARRLLTAAASRPTPQRSADLPKSDGANQGKDGGEERK